jgi:hypothetical protein
MTTGHLNPGYNNYVSGLKSALSNPSGAAAPARRRHLPAKEELEEIKANSRSVWSIKDNSETTYGYYFDRPKKVDQPPFRPSSPTRLNNPHPKKYFIPLSTL